MGRIVIFGNLRLEEYEMIIVVNVRGRIGEGGVLLIVNVCWASCMYVCTRRRT